MKKFVFLIPLFLIYLILENKQKSVLIDKTEEKFSSFSVVLTEKQLEINLEDYIIGVVACEMPASFNTEALKAMAVAARSYALNKADNYIIYTDGKDQCYITEEEMKTKWNADFNKYFNIIKESVADTKGKYLSYQKQPIKAFYFSMSNGQTENVKNVFKEDYDYLLSVSSPWDLNVNNYEKTVSFSQEEFKNKFNINNIYNLEIISRNETHRVESVKVNDVLYSGVDFRKILGLRSTDFEITLSENIIITTKGYGHGVGMSQYGANGMANEGYKYDEILEYYYKNVEINQV